jgi:hypothetical protein
MHCQALTDIQVVLVSVAARRTKGNMSIVETGVDK